MTNEEFQQQIEQMLAIQRQLQESDLRRAEHLERIDQKMEELVDMVNLQTQRQGETDQKIDQLVDVVNLQTQRLSGVIEVLGLQNEQVQELFGRVERLERRRES